MNYYWIVYFIPDPFIGGSIPVAAIVHTDKQNHLVVADKQPCVTCVGRGAKSLIEMSFETILKNIDSGIYMALGPHFSTSVIRHIPVDTADPVAWVKDILPNWGCQ